MNSSRQRSDTDEVARLRSRLERERKAREEAERLLEQKSSELYDASQQLEKEVRQVRVLSRSVDASRDGIALIDHHGNFSYVNPACALIFGYDPADLIERPLTQLFSDAERTRFYNKILPQYEKEDVWRGELAGCHKTGKPVIQDIVLSRLPNGGTIYAVRDISDRRKKEVYAREIERRLQKAEREAELFTLGNAVAHDFNNLIAAISGNVMMLKMDLQEDPDNYYRVNQIDTAIQQAAGVIRSLELERSNDTQAMVPIDLVDLMQTGLQIAGAIKPANIIIQTDFPPCAIVRTNEVLLTRCLLNIAKNAFYAMKDGGQFHLRIAKTASMKMSSGAQIFSLGEARETLCWIVELTDNGIGITPDQVSRIFEGFYTTKPKRVGSGLGLEALKSLVSNCDVRVEVESAVGEGTRFRLFFYQLDPSSITNSPPSDVSEIPVSDMAFRPREAPLTIMLVDDNALVGATLKEQIESRNMKAHWYQDPRIALAEFERAPYDYDVAITDLTMPHLNGHELAAKLKQLRSTFPIILYSGQAAYIADDTLYAAILKKPIAIDDLETTLKHAALSL